MVVVVCVAGSGIMGLGESQATQQMSSLSFAHVQWVHVHPVVVVVVVVVGLGVPQMMHVGVAASFVKEHCGQFHVFPSVGDG